MVWFQIEDDVFAHATDGGDAAVLEGCGDFPRRGLQRLGFLAQPNRVDHIAGDTTGQSARDGFHFWKFWHALSVYKDAASGAFYWPDLGGSFVKRVEVAN
jgi:hypothetical protein